MHRWLRLTSAAIQCDRLVAIEHGEWDDREQDWRAVLIFDAGARVEVREHCKEVMIRLEERHDGELARAETLPAPADAPASRGFREAHESAITLCRQYLAIAEVPEPWSHAWRAALARVAGELAPVCGLVIAQADDILEDGTPIAGAGCT